MIGEAMSVVRQCWTKETFDKTGIEKLDRIVFHFEGSILKTVTTLPDSTTMTYIETINQVVDRPLRHLGAQK